MGMHPEPDLQAGLKLHRAGDLKGARTVYEGILGVTPDHASAMHLLGLIESQEGHPQRALQRIDRAIELQPAVPAFHLNRGTVLEKLRRPQDAEASYTQAIRLDPAQADALFNRGNVRRALAQPDAALADYDAALAVAPRHQAALTNKGNLLHALGRFEEARDTHARVLEIAPGNADAHTNRAVALQDLWCIEEALAGFERAIELAPEHVEAHFNRGVALLFAGRLAEGWQEYGWRWRRGNVGLRQAPAGRPRWSPGSAARRVLVWGEQGVGDEVLFGSMLAEFRLLVPELLVQVDPRLVPLFSRAFPDACVRGHGQEWPDSLYDAHLPMGDLGLYVRPRMPATLPAAPIPSLRADAERARRLRQELAGPDQLVCGVSWKSKRAGFANLKSLTLEELLPVLRVPGVQFVNLQYGEVSQDLERLRLASGVRVAQCPSVDNFHDLDGLAALIEACDVVVTCSNLTAHLAGALGKPTHVLLAHSSGLLWYWAHQVQGRNLWYSSVSCHAQLSPRSWEHPVSRVAQALRSR